MHRPIYSLILILAVACLPAAAQELLKNPGFEEIGTNGVPVGWSQYAGGAPESQLKTEPAAHTGQNAEGLIDTGPNRRDNRYAIGLQQDVAAQPGKFYLASVWAKAIARNHPQAVCLQLTFLPGNQSFSKYLTGEIGGDWQRWSVGATAPEDAKQLRVYIYTMHYWTSETLVDDASLAVRQDSGGVNSAIWSYGHEPLTVARPLKLQTVVTQGGQPAAVIACPDDPAWKQVATELQAGMQRKTGANLTICTDVKPLLKSDQTIIALGNLNNNFIMERLYFNFYARPDSLWPGAGNFALRTVHQPFNFGDINVLTVECSDLEGAKKGVAALLQRLPESPNCALDQPLLFVSTTKLADEAGSKKIVEAPVTQDLWCDFYRAVQSWRESGEVAWALRAKRVMGLCRDRLAANPSYRITWPEETTSENIGATWDVIEEAPVWTDAERLEAVNTLFATMLSLPQHVSYWGTFADNDTILFNHSTFPLMGIYFIDRYLGRYYGGLDTVFKEYMAQVTGAFRGQIKSWKPQCDADGYLTIIPGHTMTYTLSQNDYSYFESGNVRHFAEYVTGLTDNKGVVAGFGDCDYTDVWGYEDTALPMALWYYKDPRYLWRLQQNHDGKWQNPYDQTIKPVEWQGMAGLTVWRMAPEYYRWADKCPASDEGTGGMGIPYEKAFDKVTLRENIEKSGQFLLLDGFARGKHLHYDGNAIIKYNADGEDWLIDGDYLVRNTTENTMISVIKNGRADKLEPPAATLDAQADLDTCAFTRSTMPDDNGLDWSRNILWLKGLGFVTLDRMQAREAGDYACEAVFKTLDLGEQKVTGGRVFTTVRPMDGGSGNRDLVPVQDPVPGVANAVRFADPRSRLEFPVSLPAGKYAVTIFAQGKDGSSDSFWVSIDGGEHIAFHIPIDRLGPSSSSWTKDVPTPNVTIAKDGQHVFRITLRESPGAILQKVVIQDAAGKEVTAIDASNPPPLPTELLKPSPAKRFYVKSDGTVPAFLTGRTNHTNLRLKYLHEVAARKLKAGEAVTLQNLLFNDRSDKPVNLDIRRLDDQRVLVLRDGKPWGALLTWQAPDAPYAAAWITSDRAAMVGFSVGPLTANHPVSMEVDLKTGAATVYAEVETKISVEGKPQVLPPGKTALDLSKASAFKRLQQEMAANLATAVASFKRANPPPAAAAAATLSCPGAPPVWQLPAVRQDTETAVINRIVPADLNGDGTQELLVAWGRNCVCLDHAGKRLWSVETGARANDVCTGDLNGDGKPEVLIGSDDECFYITDNQGKLLSRTHCDAALRVGRSHIKEPRVANVAIGDLDGDGKPDIIVSTRNSNICRYNLDLKQVWRYDSMEHGTFRLRLIDINKDGKLEIVAGNRYGAVRIFDPAGHVLSQTDSEIGDVVFDVGDLDGDGKNEVLNGSSTGVMNCARFNDKELWHFNNFGYAVREVRIGDFDGDGKLETAVASDTGYVYLLNADGTVKTMRNLGSGVLSLAVLGEGQATKLAAGCRDGQAYLLDGALKPLDSVSLPGPVTYLAVPTGPGGRQSIVAAAGETLTAF